MAINFGDYGTRKTLDMSAISNAAAKIAENMGTPESRKEYWTKQAKTAHADYKNKEFNNLFKKTYGDNFSDITGLLATSQGFSADNLTTAWDAYKEFAPAGGKYANSREYATAYKEHESSRAANILNQIDMLSMQPGMNMRNIQGALKNSPMLKFLMRTNPEAFMSGGKYEKFIPPETWDDYWQKHGWGEGTGYGGFKDFFGMGEQDFAEGSLIGNTMRTVAGLGTGIPAVGPVVGTGLLLGRKFGWGSGIMNWLKGNPKAAKAVEAAAKNVPESQKASWFKRTGDMIKGWMKSGKKLDAKTLDAMARAGVSGGQNISGGQSGSKNILKRAKDLTKDLKTSDMHPQFSKGQAMKNIARGGAFAFAPMALDYGVTKLTGNEKIGDVAGGSARAGVSASYLAPMVSTAVKSIKKHGFKAIMKEAVKRFGAKWALATAGKLGVATIGGAVTGGALTALMAAWSIYDIIQFTEMLTDMESQEQGNTNSLKKERADLNKSLFNPVQMESMTPELQGRMNELQQSYNQIKK
jgi:hypothetical protein